MKVFTIALTMVFEKLNRATFIPNPYPLSSFLQTVNHQWTASYDKGVIYVLVFPNMQTGYIYSSTVFYQRMPGLLRFTRNDLLYLGKHKKTYSQKRRIISRPPLSSSCINFIPASRQPYNSDICRDCNVPHMCQKE